LNTKRLILISLLVLMGLALSACGRTPISANWPGLAADAERAYVASGSFIYAVDLKSGREVWRYPAEANNALHYYANPVLTSDGQLLIGSAGTNHAFVSIDPVSGKDTWAAPFTGAKGAWIAPPLELNGLIYAPNTDGIVYILKLDGTFVDSVEIGGALWSPPVASGDRIYVASLDHHLHVIDPADPQSFKTADLEGAIPGGPTADEQGVYVGTFAARVEFVSAGGDRQTLTEPEGWVWGAPSLEGKTLYYADLEGNVYSFDLAGKDQNWPTIKPDGPIVASPLVVGDRIIVATEAGTVVALDRDGKRVWPNDYATGGKIYTTPVLSGDLILVAPYQAQFTLAALDADGKEAWTFTPAK
jgi:outer membrane protein assembly factor BamB